MNEPGLNQLPFRRPSRVWATLKALMRARVTAGLIIVLPVWITYILVKFLFEVTRDASQWVVHALVPDELLHQKIRTLMEHAIPEAWQTWMGMNDEARARTLAAATAGWGIAILSVLLTVFLLYIIGLLTANIIGRRALHFVETLLDRVPLVKTVYRGCKQIIATFGGGEGAQKFQRVGLIPFPNAQMRSPGFIMNVFRDTTTGEEMCTVFYVSTPSPTTGFVTIIRKADVIEVDWTVEETIRYVVSGGIILPEGPPFQHRLPPPADEAVADG